MGIRGFRFGAARAGFKKEGLDVGLAVADGSASAAGVFTQNRVRAAPVDVAFEHLSAGAARAVLVNSGNANACTGAEGLAATHASTRAVASALGIEPKAVLPASTGVIGAVLDAQKIQAVAAGLAGSLNADAEEQFARAILTTDRFPKVARAAVDGGAELLGIAKGAGMIHPDLAPGLPSRPDPGMPHATMLGFLFTDAVADPGVLQSALMIASDMTFNTVTVDGDTSTNDCVFVLASGASGVEASRRALTESMIQVCGDLAKAMVRDGEGAEHCVEIRVSGLLSSEDAREVARTIATSQLVKTALFGKDVNWGRILGAAGRAGVDFEPAKARIAIDGVDVVRDGVGLGADAERLANEKMAAEEYAIDVVLGDGPGEFTYTTSDLGHGYVDVNAGYRT